MSTGFWHRSEGFFGRGGFWKAVAVVVAYLVVYTGIGLLIGQVWGPSLDAGGPLASARNVTVLLLVPIALGAALITGFLALLRWLRPILGAQPVTGRGWMWIAVVIAAYPIVLRLIGIDYGAYAPGVVALTLLTGLVIGIAEELVTRGAAVALLRKRGYGELAVAVLSSVLFAAMHLTNALGTGLTLTIGVLLVYTFFFGVCMYLVMRVTGSIVWAIVAHALTDPTTILATGGVDASTGAEPNVFLTLAAPGNLVVIAFGVVALFLIRGRVGERAESRGIA